MRKKLVGGVATVALMATFSGKASAAEQYQVKPGDTLWKIANQYKTTVSNIKQLNKLSSDIIYPKQVLRVDGSKSSGSGTSASTSARSSAKASSATSSSGSTYTVKPGDYLIKIANAHGISLSQLKQWNGLSSNIIYPGQTLKVRQGGSAAPASSSSTAAAPASSSAGSSSTGSTYKVVSGDTLGKIAAKYSTTVANLKQINGLRSDLIYAGQTLKVSGSAASSTPAKQTAAPASKPAASSSGNVISVAKQQLGTKYAWGGTSPSGFDCSGFIYYVFKQAGHNISRTSTEGYYNRSYYISSPQPGDLVFFKNTYKKGISHMGVYLGGNQFIHAGNNGVEIASLNNSYWKSKFDGYKKFY
ncbi:LysM peptidoglycan-binding domain-containing protein [Siminovitchia sediminis]|uniref:LysM peptidoglycan-binding domain-containing protein n=1 Tax=Siminovitchia sediminis TaxID=1274353 RepID=A0ABW4KKW5_9BACI